MGWESLLTKSNFIGNQIFSISFVYQNDFKIKFSGLEGKFSTLSKRIELF